MELTFEPIRAESINLCASSARYAIADREDDEGLLRISLRNP